MIGQVTKRKKLDASAIQLLLLLLLVGYNTMAITVHRVTLGTFYDVATRELFILPAVGLTLGPTSNIDRLQNAKDYT